MHFCYRSRHLSRDKILSSSRAFVIEQYAVARKHVIRFSIIYDDPEAV